MSRMMPWGHPFYKICLMCLLFPLQRGAGLCHRRLVAAAEDVQGPGPPAAAAPPPKSCTLAGARRQWRPGGRVSWVKSRLSKACCYLSNPLPASRSAGAAGPLGLSEPDGEQGAGSPCHGLGFGEADVNLFEIERHCGCPGTLLIPHPKK